MSSSPSKKRSSKSKSKSQLKDPQQALPLQPQSEPLKAQFSSSSVKEEAPAQLKVEEVQVESSEQEQQGGARGGMKTIVVFAGSSHKQLANLITQRLGVDSGQVRERNFYQESIEEK